MLSTVSANVTLHCISDTVIKATCGTCCSIYTTAVFRCYLIYTADDVFRLDCSFDIVVKSKCSFMRRVYTTAMSMLSDYLCYCCSSCKIDILLLLVQAIKKYVLALRKYTSYFFLLSSTAVSGRLPPPPPPFLVLVALLLGVLVCMP